MDYLDFLDALGKKESTDDYGKENDFGRLGRYQMGESALVDAGYVAKYDKRQDGNFKYPWTGKNGIFSKEEFLDDPLAQERAVREYHRVLNGYISHYDLDKHIGKTINDVEITPGGLLAGAHLVGVGGLIDYIDSKGKDDVPDANGTPISEYIKEFAGPGGPDKEAMASHKRAASEEREGLEGKIFSASAAPIPGMK
jgi:hypothetical protein